MGLVIAFISGDGGCGMVDDDGGGGGVGTELYGIVNLRKIKGLSKYQCPFHTHYLQSYKGVNYQ